jgi:hypothetical protein
MLDYVNAKFDPPLDGLEVEQVANASSTSGPICTPEMKERCGDACIQERTAGLTARGGQLKFASEGERVVVTLASRAGTSITLDHEDLTSPAKGRVVVRKRDGDDVD